jgi:hypothetical protein
MNYYAQLAYKLYQLASAELERMEKEQAPMYEILLQIEAVNRLEADYKRLCN